MQCNTHYWKPLSIKVVATSMKEEELARRSWLNKESDHCCVKDVSGVCHFPSCHIYFSKNQKLSLIVFILTMSMSAVAAGNKRKEAATTMATTKKKSKGGYDVPWVEKYRPRNLDDVVGNEDTLVRLRAIAEDGNMPNLILCGPPGTGKVRYCLI